MRKWANGVEDLRQVVAIFVCVAVMSARAHGADSIPAKIDFNRDVRPILSDNCYACHGPDKNKRKADLRLDTRGGMFSKIETAGDGAKGGEAHIAVVAGHPEQSELWKRVSSHDRDEVMPKPSFGKTLSERQIAILKKWIEQGAEYKGHWAYLKLVRPAVPAVDRPGFVRNEIDRFVLERLTAEQLQPSPEADRPTLIRRLTLDLTGLPPTQEEVAAFVGDRDPNAYEKVVDRLLASPHFGERMAVFWLDLVRYADTIGYHSDNPMPVSLYRDWVIRSFNANLPFDRFTEMQLGGDLMSEASDDDRIASTYNRLLQTTEEGGAQAKEYIAKYDADRVRNVSTVWLGATMGCCQCHDHKFDPYTQKDFYSLAAFFADIQEPAVGGRGPGTPVPDAAQKQELARMDAAMAEVRKKLDGTSPELTAAELKWEHDLGQTHVRWTSLAPSEAKVTGTSHLRTIDGDVLLDEGKAADRENYSIRAASTLSGITGIRLEALPDDVFAAHGPGRATNGNFVMTEFKVAAAKRGGPAEPVKLIHASADFSQDGFPVTNAIDGKPDTGWAVMPAFGVAHTAVFEPEHPLDADELVIAMEFQSQFAQHQIGKFRLSITTDPSPARPQLPGNVQTLLSIDPEKRTPQQSAELSTYYRSIAPLLQPARDELAALGKKKEEYLKTVPATLMTIAGPPRTIRLLHRGNWMDDSGAEMTPAVPERLGKVAVEGRRPNRLDLARWLADENNPLTARVFANRVWRTFYGTGISKGMEDLGSQGEWPTHPELLDWLAAEFQGQAGSSDPQLRPWDVKHLVRLMVSSGTYRQSSQVSPELRERDPFNRLYARQSRFRLDAEFVRDNALAVSGLLVDSVGGPSVKPYQPSGYWDALNFPTRTYQADHGPNEYRRGLYTWWQRSFLHPSLLAFDAPSHEEAVCERSRSNIPQQALVLLNDPTYVESSRAFAEKIIRLGGDNTAARVKWAFSRAVARAPRPEEIEVLTVLFDRQQKEYSADPGAAQKFLADGDYVAPKEIPPADLAAWANVARAILNLHETLTRS